MAMKMVKNLQTGVVLPQVEGDLCEACGHEKPGSANTSWPIHYEPGTEGTIAQGRPDILYMTWAEKGQQPGHHLTLYSLDSFPPHVMLLLTTYLREKGRSEAGREELARYGIGVASTHDTPGQGHQINQQQAMDLLARGK